MMPSGVQRAQSPSFDSTESDVSMELEKAASHSPLPGYI